MVHVLQGPRPGPPVLFASILGKCTYCLLEGGRVDKGENNLSRKWSSWEHIREEGMGIHERNLVREGRRLEVEGSSTLQKAVIAGVVA